MYAFTRRPAWLVLHLVVLAIVAAFIRLGFWQLERLDERRAENLVAEQRLAESPGTWRLSEGTPSEYTRLKLRGEFRPSEEVLLRSQTYLGQPGFHLITPLYLETGGAVFVNRGWVPLATDEVDSPGSRPAAGGIEVTGFVRWPRPDVIGTEVPDSRIVASIDPAGLADLTGATAAEFYLVATDINPVIADIPILASQPELSDGPHLSYAFQWFAFALVGGVGYLALLRSTARRPGRVD